MVDPAFHLQIHLPPHHDPEGGRILEDLYDVVPCQLHPSKPDHDHEVLHALKRPDRVHIVHQEPAEPELVHADHRAGSKPELVHIDLRASSEPELVHVFLQDHATAEPELGLDVL